MLIYLSVFLVVLILALAYFHGVCAKVVTKNSDFPASILYFKNVQHPYLTVDKVYSQFMKKVSAFPPLQKLLKEGKLKCFGNFYDNPNKVRDHTQLRSSIGILISQDDYNSLDSKTEVDSALQELQEQAHFKKVETPSVLTRYSSFPYRSPLSFKIAPVKVYPAFMRDVRKGEVDFKALQIDAGCLEIYSKKAIEFHLPVGPNRPHFKLTEAEKPVEIDSEDDYETEE